MKNYLKKEPFAHTYSIVAIDPLSGDMGIAVQSHWFSVGSLVAWGKAGVGVVVTQSFVNKSFGPRGLSLLEEGLNPKEIIKTMLKTDEGRDVRQLAILDSYGKVEAYTGKNCIEEAGHIAGDGFCVQANLMEKNTVWFAMKKAFENSKGTLAERMLISLKAAQDEGGDIRGKQSAVILVVRAKSTGNSWEDNLVDLRVDDHEEPLKELQRLLKIHNAYFFMNEADKAIGYGDIDLAKEHYKNAQKLNPDNLEMKYWQAIFLANQGEIEEAKLIFKEIFDQDNNWKKLTPRFFKAKLLSIKDEQLKDILEL